VLRPLEGVEHRVRLDPAGLHEQADVELSSDDGRHAQHLVGGRREPGQAPADDLPHALGEPELGHDPLGGVGPGPAQRRPGFGQVLNHLPDEERVAVGLAVDSLGQCLAEGVERVSGPPSSNWATSASSSPPNVMRSDPGLPAQGSQQRGEDVVVVDLGRGRGRPQHGELAPLTAGVLELDLLETRPAATAEPGLRRILEAAAQTGTAERDAAAPAESDRGTVLHAAMQTDHFAAAHLVRAGANV
jgi:hypothetical protein